MSSLENLGICIFSSLFSHLRFVVDDLYDSLVDGALHQTPDVDENGHPLGFETDAVVLLVAENFDWSETSGFTYQHSPIRPIQLLGFLFKLES